MKTTEYIKEQLFAYFDVAGLGVVIALGNNTKKLEYQCIEGLKHLQRVTDYYIKRLEKGGRFTSKTTLAVHYCAAARAVLTNTLLGVIPFDVGFNIAGVICEKALSIITN